MIKDNYYLSDAILQQFTKAFPDKFKKEVTSLGSYVCSVKGRELVRILSKNEAKLNFCPQEKSYSNNVDYHPAYHALMRYSVSMGLTNSLSEDSFLADEQNTISNRYLYRSVKLFLMAQLEPSHLSNISSTSAGFSVGLDSKFFRKILASFVNSRIYDPTAQTAMKKAGVIFSSVNMPPDSQVVNNDAFIKLSNGQLAVVAEEIEDSEQISSHAYRLANVKLLVNNPIADGYFILANCEDRPIYLFCPRFLPSGKDNGIKICHLPSKIGEGVVATAYVEFSNTIGWQIGKEADGIFQQQEFNRKMQFDQSIILAGIMRSALSEVLTYYSDTKLPLVLQSVVSDISLDIAAITTLIMRLSTAYEDAGTNPVEAAFVLVLIPVVRYYASRVAPQAVLELMRAVGEPAFFKEGILANLLSNTLNMDADYNKSDYLAKNVIDILVQSPEMLEHIFTWIEENFGPAKQGILEVLQATARLAINDVGTAQLFMEQLALSVAAAAMRVYGMNILADSFIATRLAGPWRFSYGLVNSPHAFEEIFLSVYSDNKTSDKSSDK